MPFELHPDCESPSSDSVSIWRYMNLSKFVWMLEHHALYFSRLGNLEDTFEGALPALVLPLLRAGCADWYVVEKNCGQSITERIVDITRNATFVNCWHLNEYESAAMCDYTVA